MYKYYSPENIKLIQDECERRGWGRPAPDNLRYYMNLALLIDRGQFNVSCVPNYMQLLDQFVDVLNKRTLAIIEPYIYGIKFGLEQYYRDINQMRDIPEYPMFRSEGARRADVPLEFPYYHGGMY
jgi:hypothetical protein